jgi:hypothetical protein
MGTKRGIDYKNSELYKNSYKKNKSIITVWPEDVLR